MNNYYTTLVTEILNVARGVFWMYKWRFSVIVTGLQRAVWRNRRLRRCLRCVLLNKRRSANRIKLFVAHRVFGTVIFSSLLISLAWSIITLTVLYVFNMYTYVVHIFYVHCSTRSAHHIAFTVHYIVVMRAITKTIIFESIVSETSARGRFNEQR